MLWYYGVILTPLIVGIVLVLVLVLEATVLETSLSFIPGNWYPSVTNVVLVVIGFGGRRSTLRPASDATWRPEMTCAFPGLDSYALLVLVWIFIVC